MCHSAWLLFFLFGFSREGLTMEPQTAWNLLCRSGWLQTCNNLSASAVRTWNYKHGSPPARMTGSYQSSSTRPLAPPHKLAKALRLAGTRAYCREKTVALLLQIVKEPGFCPWPFLKLILTIAIKLYMYDSQIHFFHLNLFWAFLSVFLHTGHHHPDMAETLWTHISMMKPVFPLALDVLRQLQNHHSPRYLRSLPHHHPVSHCIASLHSIWIPV